MTRAPPKSQPPTKTRRRYHIIQPPNTPKEKAIVDAALQNPDGTNPEVARKAKEIGGLDEQPDPSWVSRVRNQFLEEVEDEEPDYQHLDGRLDESADLEEMAERVEELEEVVDDLIDMVNRLHESLDRIENREREEAVERIEDHLDELRGDASA